MDYRLCSRHLAAVKHLLIAKSKRLHEVGAAGMGLYAARGKVAKDADGYPARARTVVFRKDDEIGEYGGERMTREEFRARYKDDRDLETASYAESGTTHVFDGLSAASAMSYSNESLNIVDLMHKAGRSKRRFEQLYNEASKRDRRANALSHQRRSMVRLYAARAIHQGEEILWHYGPQYWSSVGMKRVLTGSGWS